MNPYIIPGIIEQNKSNDSVILNNLINKHLPTPRHSEYQRALARTVAREYMNTLLNNDAEVVKQKRKNTPYDLTLIPKDIAFVVTEINDLLGCNILSTTRLMPVPDGKKIFASIMTNMGYHPSQICKYIGRDRTAIYSMLKECDKFEKTDKAFAFKLNLIREKVANVKN